MLARIPFWGWLLTILAVLYLVYNPLGFSVFHMWINGDPTELLPFKILGTLILVAIIGLVIHGTLSSMNLVGFSLLAMLVIVTVWSTHALVNFDILSFDFWAWALQPILAVMLTVGWQWPKIWRRSTGAVSVNDPDSPA